jgi:hypothetical protein
MDSGEGASLKSVMDKRLSVIWRDMKTVMTTDSREITFWQAFIMNSNRSSEKKSQKCSFETGNGKFAYCTELKRDKLYLKPIPSTLCTEAFIMTYSLRHKGKILPHLENRSKLITAEGKKQKAKYITQGEATVCISPTVKV